MIEPIKPKPRFPKDYKIDPSTLAAGRYGTLETVEIWGPVQTFDCSLKVQGQAPLTLSRLCPNVVDPKIAQEIAEKATVKYVNPDRIRELEEEIGHDAIAINISLEEVVSREAASHVGQARTSADTTQTARALQLKSSLEVIADSVENLRDILIDKSLAWIDVPHMDVTHLYDALPTVAGRPFSHYAEMLQSDLDFLKYVYENSIVGKWADATGNHHSAVSLGVDGIKLQEEYCKDLGIKFMDASAQVPGHEFEADVVYVLARFGETMNNIAKYIASGRSDDVNIFVNANPKKKKGSSAMPHKDAKNGNPTAEEQTMSLRNYLVGNLVTALMNCEIPYARNLAPSANSRINFEDGFKFMDHTIRNLANIAYWISLNEERCKERVLRSYGCVTSQEVMNYLTDSRKVANPMPRSEAHDLTAKLATQAWETKTQFYDVCLANEEIMSKIDKDTLKNITNPLTYIGQSKEIIKIVAEKYHHKKTL